MEEKSSNDMFGLVLLWPSSGQKFGSFLCVGFGFGFVFFSPGWKKKNKKKSNKLYILSARPFA